MLIKFNNQITEVNHTLPMRILYIVISTTYWLFNVSVHATLKNYVASLGRQLFTDIPVAWMALPPLPVGRDRGAVMALRAENSWQNLSNSVN